jgi:transcriptional regulator with XRE-family HTH domain
MPRRPSKTSRLGYLRFILKSDGKELAAEAGISYQLLKMIETGRRTITETTAKKVSTATGVSKEWLLGQGPKTKPPTDRASLQRFSGEILTREYYLSIQARANKDIILSSRADVEDFCRLEAQGNARLFEAQLTPLLRFAARCGEEKKVLFAVDSCFRTLEKLEEKLHRQYMTNKELSINQAFRNALKKRRAAKAAESSSIPPPRRAGRAPGNS